MTNKEKAVNAHGYKAQLDDIQIFHDRGTHVKIFYSALRGKLHVSTTSMTEDGIEFENALLNALVALNNIKREAPELVEGGE